MITFLSYIHHSELLISLQCNFFRNILLNIKTIITYNAIFTHLQWRFPLLSEYICQRTSCYLFLFNIKLTLLFFRDTFVEIRETIKIRNALLFKLQHFYIFDKLPFLIQGERIRLCFTILSWVIIWIMSWWFISRCNTA